MPDYPLGSSTYRTSRPILDSYADTDALTRPCPNCGAAVQDFCRLDGVLRKVPCMTRTRTKGGNQ